MIASLILALYLFGLIAAPKAAAFLLVTGILLLIGEAVFTTGILALNGVLALYVAYTLQYGQSEVFGQPVGWDVLFGIAFVELVILGVLTAIFLRLRKEKPSTGVESMIGQKADVIEWNGHNGLIRVHGEIWKAQSDTPLSLQPGASVHIADVNGLIVKINL